MIFITAMMLEKLGGYCCPANLRRDGFADFLRAGSFFRGLGFFFASAVRSV